MSGPRDERAPARPPETPGAEARPQTVIERQSSISLYLLHRARRRRELFLRRAAAFSLRKELARNAYLAGCLLFDLLVIPEVILVLPFPWGWAVSLTGMAVAVWLEYRFYRAHFALPEPADDGPTP